MALANVLTLSQIAGNIIIFILSLCVIIPISMNMREFNGHCLLFTVGEWREEDGLFNACWGSKGFCEFPLITAALLFFSSCGNIYRLTRLVYREGESSFLALFLDVVLGVCLCAMSFASSLMITLGFIVWCSKMTERFPSCEIVAGQNITKYEENINTTGFYIEMGTAQFGVWGVFATTVGVTVISLLKLINNHQMCNMRVSMYLERQRLMNEGQYSPGEGRSTPPLEIADFNPAREGNSTPNTSKPTDNPSDLGD